jgi:hypothetical protein
MQDLGLYPDWLATPYKRNSLGHWGCMYTLDCQEGFSCPSRFKPSTNMRFYLGHWGYTLLTARGTILAIKGSHPSLEQPWTKRVSLGHWDYIPSKFKRNPLDNQGVHPQWPGVYLLMAMKSGYPQQPRATLLVVEGVHPQRPRGFLLAFRGFFFVHQPPKNQWFLGNQLSTPLGVSFFI